MLLAVPFTQLVKVRRESLFWYFRASDFHETLALNMSRKLGTITDKKWICAPTGKSRVWRRCFGPKNQFLLEMVQKSSDGPKMVKVKKGFVLFFALNFCLCFSICLFSNYTVLQKFWKAWSGWVYGVRSTDGGLRKQGAGGTNNSASINPLIIGQSKSVALVIGYITLTSK